MNRLASAAGAVVAGLLFASSPQLSAAPDTRALPMQFEQWTEGPAQACADRCRTWISATGAITADTPRDFETFIKTHKIEGMTIALDSDGGSVLGALALGRSIRKLGMITTVGRTVDLSSNDGHKRAKLLPRAFCESMCAFVLLAGVKREVPAEARVMVHQIWLGDRRDDPTAANYSAEDLVVVQRDIGRLAQFTFEMGGSVDLLELALRIPPWEPMRQLSRDELRSMKMTTTSGDSTDASSGPTTNSVALSSGARAAVNSRAWAMLAGESRPAVGRSHPLTVEGEDLGTFDLAFACSEQGRDLIVNYTEHRRASEGTTPAALTEVDLSIAGRSVPLKVVSSRAAEKGQGGGAAGLATLATGRVPLDVLQNFADRNGRSLTVETVSDDASTVVRVGNAGISRVLPSLSAGCAAVAGQQRVRNSTRTAARQQGGG
jgi:hypothetical protein